MANRWRLGVDWHRSVGFLACIVMTVGCPPGVHHYNLRGEVVAMGPGVDQLTVKHEDVPGFMSAMTMVFPVKGSKVVSDIKPGDLITAVVVTANNGMDYWLENVKVIDRSGEKDTAPEASPLEPH